MKELTVEDLAKSYPESGEVLRGASFSLRLGETLAILGPSGSGKSTLLNLLGALERPDAGTINIDDNRLIDATTEPSQAYRNRTVGFIFQDHLLLPQLTALENVLVPTLVWRRGGEEERARRILDRVGLGERTNHFPAQLSGGEKQRVALARALINEPPLLLCDEPTGNLDERTGAAIGELLLEIVHEQPAMAVMVTHDADWAGRFDRRLALSDGKLLALVEDEA